jgi:hypothetical protein
MERCRKRLENCSARLSKEGCKVILHHLFYPERKYIEAGPEYVEFREHMEFRVPMCKGREIRLHQEEPDGPPLPEYSVVQAVNQALRSRKELAARPIHRP